MNIEEDIKKIIENISNKNDVFEYELTEERRGAGKVYQKEAVKKPAEPDMPSIYKEMYLINPTVDYVNGYRKSDTSYKFYLQAVFMKDFSDNYDNPTSSFYTYHPSYGVLSARELRWYFTWRGRYRKGEIIDVSLTFLLIYAFELINNIGVQDGEDGFFKLKKLLYDFKAIKPNLEYYLTPWLADYIAYYNIKNAETDFFVKKEFSEKLVIISQAAAAGVFDRKAVEILNAASSYKILNSKFYNDSNGELYNGALAYVFSDMSKFYKENRSIPLLSKLFGKSVIRSWFPFAGAVFYERDKTDRQISVNEFEKYTLQKGQWFHIYRDASMSNIKLIGEILKITEYFLRVNTGYKYNISYVSSSEILTELIKGAVLRYCVEHDKMNILKAPSKKKIAVDIEPVKPVKVEFDISKFENIRKNAEIIKEKLIIDEESADCNSEREAKNDIEAKNDGGGLWSSLSELEKQAVICLCENNIQDLQAAADKAGIMLEVLLEAINEKALIHINDNLIDTAEMFIYNDYKDYLSEVFLL